MKTPFRIPATLLLVMFLFGCGQSGPLYITGDPSTIEPTASQTDAEDEEKKEAESSENQ